MLIIFGLVVFFMIIAASFALKGYRERNPLVDIFKSAGKTKGNNKTFKESLAGIWELDKPSAALTFDTSLALGLGSAAVVFLFLFLIAGPLVAVIAALLFFIVIPILANAGAKTKRIKDFKATLESVLDIFTGCLAAGMPFNDALKETVRTTPHGIVKNELSYIYKQITDFNSTPEKAFSMLAIRVPCTETKELRDAIILYQRIGGPEALNLLRSVIENMRKASAARHEIEQKKRGVRMTAMLVGGGPVVYIIGMFFVSPDMTHVLFGTGTGRICLLFSVVIFFAALGWLWSIFQSIEEF